MVQLIVGNKGKGKTKHLLNRVNTEVQTVSGNIVYLDKSAKHMYELNNKIRLIDVSSYFITNLDEFAGFICGIISQDHDLEQMYFDSFMEISCIGPEQLETTITKLEKISEAFHVKFVISISLDEDELPVSLKDKIAVSL